MSEEAVPEIKIIYGDKKQAEVCINRGDTAACIYPLSTFSITLDGTLAAHAH
jgi:hypothetical protein